MSDRTPTYTNQTDRVLYEVLEIGSPASSTIVDARVAELADAALLKSAPEQGPGSSPGAGIIVDPAPETTAVVRSVQLVDIQDGEMPGGDSEVVCSRPGRPPSAVEVLAAGVIATAVAGAFLMVLGMAGTQPR